MTQPATMRNLFDLSGREAAIVAFGIDIAG